MVVVYPLSKNRVMPRVDLFQDGELSELSEDEASFLDKYQRSPRSPKRWKPADDAAPSPQPPGAASGPASISIHGHARSPRQSPSPRARGVVARGSAARPQPPTRPSALPMVLGTGVASRADENQYEIGLPASRKRQLLRQFHGDDAHAAVRMHADMVREACATQKWWVHPLQVHVL